MTRDSQVTLHTAEGKDGQPERDSLLPHPILWLGACAHTLFLVPGACHLCMVCPDLSLLSNLVAFRLPRATASCSTLPC